jgi:hypothetical protein
MRNVVRMTVLTVVVLLAGGIGSAAASEPLPNIQKPLALPQGIGFWTLGQEKCRGNIFSS